MAATTASFGLPIAWDLQPGQTASMTSNDARVDRIVQDLLDRQLTREERIKLLRELVRRGGEMPEEVLDEALRKLMERLTE